MKKMVKSYSFNINSYIKNNEFTLLFLPNSTLKMRNHLVRSVKILMDFEEISRKKHVL